MNEHFFWAQQQFGRSELGDPRRTARLVKLASTLATEPGKPLVNVTQSPADMEGAYRFIRNDQLKAEDIAEAGFYVTAQEAFEQQKNENKLSEEDMRRILEALDREEKKVQEKMKKLCPNTTHGEEEVQT